MFVSGNKFLGCIVDSQQELFVEIVSFKKALRANYRD